MLGLLEKREVDFRRLSPTPYASGLRSAVRTDEPERLLDILLVCALIEARSCERMKVLAEGLADDEPVLADFYRSLLASEARHHALYVDLADQLFERAEVRTRLDEITEMPPMPRMHT